MSWVPDSPPKMRRLIVHGNVVELWPSEGDNDYVIRIPLARVDWWLVNWVPEGGRISVRHSGCVHDVTFEAGDQGEACADAIQALEEAFNR